METIDILLDKAALRKAHRLARAMRDPDAKARLDAAIAARVLAWWRALGAAAPASIGVYWPLKGEPDLTPAYAELAASGVALALPVVLAPDAALGFSAWLPGEAMLSDPMGVAVPAQQRMVERPPVLLVPCLGFNAHNFRLGYGGGYYDRTLAAQPRPLTAGVAYAGELARFAGAPHDVALDVIITDA